MAARQEEKRSAREQREAREHAAARAQRRKTLSIYATGGLLAAIVIATLLAVTLTGSGDTSGAGAAQAGHIHGLGVNPADGSLYVATHGGLFRAAVGSTDAPRVGSSDRDLMGFSVIGGDHFVASGHPGSERGLPGNIGLTQSRDGGRTWESVSLLGEADFHVLRASGTRIYGYDGPGGRFMVSTDTGSNWLQRDLAAAPFDLVIDPGDRDHVIAATESGLLESRDAGRSWRALSKQVALLAWPERDRLVMLDGSGRVLVSTDGGRTARPQGTVRGQAVSFMAHGDAIYVALADGSVMQSSDGGGTFTVRARV